MNTQNDRIEAFWQDYLDTLADDSPVRNEEYTAERFGDSPELADELGTLIVSGTKTATCSALWEYKVQGEPVPEVGTTSIVLSGNDEPLCVIETTEVEIRPYDDVDERFAYEEGEEDRSLEYWREAHWRFFSRNLPNIRRTNARHAAGVRAVPRGLQIACTLRDATLGWSRVAYSS